jgi:hypothetical protein
MQSIWSSAYTGFVVGPRILNRRETSNEFESCSTLVFFGVKSLVARLAIRASSEAGIGCSAAYEPLPPDLFQAIHIVWLIQIDVTFNRMRKIIMSRVGNGEDVAFQRCDVSKVHKRWLSFLR